MHLLLILFFRQLSRSFSKSGWIRLVWFITMTWFMQGCIIYYVKEYKMHPEVLETLNENMVIAIASICVSSFFFDFLFKLLFKHDATVMDAYLKTRPVTSNTWNRFLIVSQFWNPFNLLLPFLCIVGCFMLFHFAWGLLLFLLLYLISVANGTLIMLIKRGGTYD